MAGSLRAGDLALDHVGHRTLLAVPSWRAVSVPVTYSSQRVEIDELAVPSWRAVSVPDPNRMGTSLMT